MSSEIQKQNLFNVQLTENAGKKIFSLIEEEDDFNLKLRIFITGGGCSGFQYGFTFDDETREDDEIFKKELENGHIVYLLVDAMSLQYLVGATIDYKEDIEGSRFIIKNPNASGSCGCGNSFDV